MKLIGWTFHELLMLLTTADEDDACTDDKIELPAFDGIDDNFDCDFVWCDGDSNEEDWNGHHDDFGFDNCELEWSDVFEEWEIEC